MRNPCIKYSLISLLALSICDVIQAGTSCDPRTLLAGKVIEQGMGRINGVSFQVDKYRSFKTIEDFKNQVIQPLKGRCTLSFQPLGNQWLLVALDIQTPDCPTCTKVSKQNFWQVFQNAYTVSFFPSSTDSLVVGGVTGGLMQKQFTNAAYQGSLNMEGISWQHHVEYLFGKRYQSSSFGQSSFVGSILSEKLIRHLTDQGLKVSREPSSTEDGHGILNVRGKSSLTRIIISPHLEGSKVEVYEVISK